mmetsp:Transcript_33701/g.107066  ORF Transcript_33701/g.107066 Transcript_33701/m.107066 type:complete len:253 (-) Transcript_33701:1089-1847(-)
MGSRAAKLSACRRSADARCNARRASRARRSLSSSSTRRAGATSLTASRLRRPGRGRRPRRARAAGVPRQAVALLQVAAAEGLVRPLPQLERLRRPVREGAEALLLGLVGLQDPQQRLAGLGPPLGLQRPGLGWVLLDVEDQGLLLQDVVPPPAVLLLRPLAPLPVDLGPAALAAVEARACAEVRLPPAVPHGRGALAGAAAVEEEELMLGPPVRLQQHLRHVASVVGAVALQRHASQAREGGEDVHAADHLG